MSVCERCPAFNSVRLQAQLRLGPCATASGPTFERIWPHVQLHLLPDSNASAPMCSCICSQIRTHLLPRSRTKIGIKQAKLQGTITKMDCKSINYQAFVYFYIDYNQKNT